MSTLERLERANPVPDADRLLSAPGAMDDFVLAVKERSGIVRTTEDRPPIEVPIDTKSKPTRKDWRRRLVPVLAAAAAVIAAILVVVALSSTEPDVAASDSAATITFDGTACTYTGPSQFTMGVEREFFGVNDSDSRVVMDVFRTQDGNTVDDFVDGTQNPFYNEAGFSFGEEVPVHGEISWRAIPSAPVPDQAGTWLIACFAPPGGFVEGGFEDQAVATFEVVPSG